MVEIKQIRVCGDVSPNKHGNQVICTESPDHEGNHKTIYSVDNSKIGFQYSWSK